MKLKAPKEANQILFVTSRFFFEMARTLPHAILILFLAERFNAHSSFVLGLNVIMYFSIFAFEIPSGFLSDVLFNKKFVYMFSIISMIMAFTIFAFASQLWWFIVGQVFYGISTACASGTIEVAILKKLNPSDQKLFLNNERVAVFLGSAIGGGVGSLLYFYLNQNLYFVCAGLAAFSLLIAHCVSVKEKKEVDSLKTFKRDIKEVFWLNISFFRDKNYLILLISLISISFVLAPFFYFWPLFYEQEGVPKQWMGIVYVSFQLLGMLSAFLNQRLKENRVLEIISALLAAAFFALCMLIFEGYVFMFCFPLIYLFINYYLFSNQNQFFRLLHHKTGGSQTSIMSTFRAAFTVVIYGCAYLISLLLDLKMASLVCSIIFIVITLIMFLFKTTLNKTPLK